MECKTEDERALFRSLSISWEKQIPKAVNLRIGKLSANEKIFKESSKRYTEALKNSGFKEDFRYLKQNITTEITKENNNYVQKNRNRKRKIIWFNPPFL